MEVTEYKTKVAEAIEISLNWWLDSLKTKQSVGHIKDAKTTGLLNHILSKRKPLPEEVIQSFMDSYREYFKTFIECRRYLGTYDYGLTLKVDYEPWYQLAEIVDNSLLKEYSHRLPFKTTMYLAFHSDYIHVYVRQNGINTDIFRESFIHG